MYDFDEFDDEYDLSEDEDDLEDEDRLLRKEDDLIEEEDKLMEKEDKILESEDRILAHEDNLREAAEELDEDLREEVEDQLDDLRDTRDDISDMRRELEEIRRMKEQLRHEIEGVRHEKEQERHERRTYRSTTSIPRPPKPPRPVKPPRRAAIVDFEALTDSLEEMMDGLGDQIRMSVSGLKDVGKEFVEPFRDVRIASKRAKRKGQSRSKTEDIPPERVASVITPLASEERLKILDFLKGGGRTFNDLEIHTGKTGSSLTHHLNPLLEAGYVIKGEVRGTYYLAIEGRLAYRLAQWLTDRLEREIRLKDVKETKLKKTMASKEGDVKVIIEDDDEEDEE